MKKTIERLKEIKEFFRAVDYFNGDNSKTDTTTLDKSIEALELMPKLVKHLEFVATTGYGNENLIKKAKELIEDESHD